MRIAAIPRAAATSIVPTPTGNHERLGPSCFGTPPRLPVGGATSALTSDTSDIFGPFSVPIPSSSTLTVSGSPAHVVAQVARAVGFVPSASCGPSRFRFRRRSRRLSFGATKTVPHRVLPRSQDRIRCPVCAVISSRLPVMPDDLRVCDVDMSLTRCELGDVESEGRQTKGNG